MNYYGGKDLAASFRTVRKNTVTIAEEIPEDKYSFQVTPESETISKMLAHIAVGPRFQEQINFVEKRTSMAGFDWMTFRGVLEADMNKPRSKAELVALLKDQGEKFAAELAGLSDEFLGESVTMPPGGNVPSRTRFDMLASVKEHEMHHRAQLMLIQRLLGMTPHLTREHQARMAAMREAAMQKA